MPGLTSGGFYDRYATQKQLANQSLGMMSQHGMGKLKYEKPEDDDDDKTFGGALMAGLGGAGTGAMMAAPAGGVTAAGGGAAGFGVGFAAYMMS